jgi:hypothetical protein
MGGLRGTADKAVSHGNASTTCCAARDSWQTPRRVHRRHGPNQLFGFVRNRPPARFARPRQLPPMFFEAPALPANDSIWFHENECILPSRPSFREKAPQDPVCLPRLRTFYAPLVNAQPMPQRQILCLKRRTRPEHGGQETGAQPDEFQHVGATTLKPAVLALIILEVLPGLDLAPPPFIPLVPLHR